MRNLLILSLLISLSCKSQQTQTITRSWRFSEITNADTFSLLRSGKSFELYRGPLYVIEDSAANHVAYLKSDGKLIIIDSLKTIQSLLSYILILEKTYIKHESK